MPCRAGPARVENWAAAERRMPVDFGAGPVAFVASTGLPVGHWTYDAGRKWYFFAGSYVESVVFDIHLLRKCWNRQNAAVDSVAGVGEWARLCYFDLFYNGVAGASGQLIKATHARAQIFKKTCCSISFLRCLP